MSELPPELRDRAAKAAMSAHASWAKRFVYEGTDEPVSNRWNVVVDAVAEVVLAGSQPKEVVVKKIGKGSFKVPCTYGGQKITFRGHNEVDAHAKADAYERGYDDGLSQKNEYHYGIHSVQPEYRVYYLKGFSHGESLSIPNNAQDRDALALDSEVRVAGYSKLLRGMARRVGERRDESHHYATRLMEAYGYQNDLRAKLDKQRKRRKAAEAKVIVLEAMIRSYRDCLLLTRRQLDDTRKELPDE